MSLQIEIVKPAIGAIVSLDRSRIGDPDIAQELLTLLERHTVLVFPEANFTDEEQLALTDALGERVNISAKVPGHADAKDVYEITLNEGASIEKEYVYGTFFWHIDGMTVPVPPPKASVLSARQLSAEGGQTEFANTRAAYEALPASVKESLENLRVVHTVTASVREVCGPEALDDVRRSLRQEHPLVWKHQDGTRSLIIGYTADQITNMPQAEGRALLARLLDWTAQPAFSYLHDWRVGDCVIWDNTSAVHRVVPYKEDSGRRMHRTGVAGVEEVG